MNKRKAFLSVDLEDYRRQQLRDHLGGSQSANPEEVLSQLEQLLELFATCQARATFFTVGRLTEELPSSVWPRITALHQLGCHGHEHIAVRKLGPERFEEDLRKAKAALERAGGKPVVSFRAPYFSSDGCDPWFGQVLARAGFKLDSSRRINSASRGFQGSIELEGSEGSVLEVPLPSIGFGPKRLTVIGGTYFRLLPLSTIQWLLSRAEEEGFIPMVYLHPYDIDPKAAPLAYPSGHWTHKAGDWMRRCGRESACEKLRELSRIYDFQPLESALKTAVTA